IEKDRYKNSLRKKLSNQVEKDKFKKFSLREIDPVLKYDEDINNHNLCELCNKRKKIDDESCVSCSKFVNIGRDLAKSSFMTISKGSGQISIIADYYINFVNEIERIDNAIAIFDIQNDEVFRGYAKWELKSYVKIDDEKNILTFEDLAKNSVKNGKKDNKREHGVEALMALKGDVDGMGNFIKDKNSQVTNSFARYNFFSRMIDYFFSVKASKMMEGRDLYTVFAGGDDIFVLGAWDEVIEFAKELREEFMKFADGSDLTLSVGMVMTKPNKPINFVADISEKALEKAKEIDENKDAISLFGETVKWDKYTDKNNAQYFLEELEYFDENYLEINTGFLYRLLEFIQMSKESKNNPLQTIWKSKLAYSFSRNILEKVKNDSTKLKEAKRLLAFINNMIEKEPEISKMILSEFIYKRRIV
ncbi:MAG: hypothetical protein GXP61_06610, partial [Epsilonproteobacteria bacterium]|nr:hypothetical protein [Campylobacterota bacterium]